MNESKLSSKELWQQARNAPGTSDYRRAHLELQRRWESSQRPAAATAEPIMPSDKAVALKQWAGASAPVKDAPPPASLRKATVNLSDYVAAPAPSRGPFGEGEATLCLQPEQAPSPDCAFGPQNAPLPAPKAEEPWTSREWASFIIWGVIAVTLAILIGYAAAHAGVD